MGAPWMAPWLRFASRCAGERARTKDDWFAMMTGRRAQTSQPFGGWGFFGAQPPFGGPWFGGAPGWRASKASPGSIYPTLQQLEDEGLVRADEDSGRRTFTLTDEGQTYVAEHPDEVSAPWKGFADSGEEDRKSVV